MQCLVIGLQKLCWGLPTVHSIVDIHDIFGAGIASIFIALAALILLETADVKPGIFWATDYKYEHLQFWQQHDSDLLLLLTDCRPVQFWMLSRHGTRYPDKKTISIMQHLPDLRDQIINNHEKRKSQ
jgi:hypothetical protein